MEKEELKALDDLIEAEIEENIVEKKRRLRSIY